MKINEATTMVHDHERTKMKQQSDSFMRCACAAVR